MGLKLMSGIIPLGLFLSLVASPSAASMAEWCQDYKDCRRDFKKSGPRHDTLPKYDMSAESQLFSVGEFNCMEAYRCAEPRKKFCSKHQDDGSKFVKILCTTFQKEGYSVDLDQFNLPYSPPSEEPDDD